MPTQLVRVRVLKNNIPGVNKLMPEVVKQIAWETAQKIFEEAQATVPYRTGALHDSGSIRGTKYGYNVGYDIYYAPMVHDGTSNMAARPWLQIAAIAQLPFFAAQVKYARDRIVQAGTK